MRASLLFPSNRQWLRRFALQVYVKRGARVIKIERESGDFARGYDSVAGGDSSCFVWANLGKESLVLDFKKPEDAELRHRILEKADVFVQNLVPGALQRAGFGSEALRSTYTEMNHRFNT